MPRDLGDEAAALWCLQYLARRGAFVTPHRAGLTQLLESPRTGDMNVRRLP